MNNREKVKEQESYHILIALARKKDGNEKELCFRQIVRDKNTDMAILKAKVGQTPGKWRIYETINKRLVEPAYKLLMKHLIDEPDRFKWRIDSLWKSCLLQSCCKAERNFMVDVDKKLNLVEISELCEKWKIIPYKIIDTPNGHHILTKNIDTRLVNEDYVEVKRDSYVFVERFEIK